MKGHALPEGGNTRLRSAPLPAPPQAEIGAFQTLIEPLSPSRSSISMYQSRTCTSTHRVRASPHGLELHRMEKTHLRISRSVRCLPSLHKTHALKVASGHLGTTPPCVSHTSPYVHVLATHTGSCAKDRGGFAEAAALCLRNETTFEAPRKNPLHIYSRVQASPRT